MISANDQYLTFRVAHDEYGVAILGVREIVPFRPLTRIPTTPSYIRGVFNLVGRVIPVIDLSVKFGFGESLIHSRSCVVVTELPLDGDMTMLGFLVDAIGEVVDLPREAIEPPPPFGIPVRLDYLAGVGRCAGRMVLLLDIERVLSSLEILGMTRLAGQAGAAAAPAAMETV